MLAGATAVSVGTAVFNDPKAPARIHDELAQEAKARGFSKVEDLIGYAHRSEDAPIPVAPESSGLDEWDFITE